ncbi:MAG: TIGR00269 family protein [Candidatus Bathyarchaeia archaeon]
MKTPECTKCSNRPSVYYRRYSGERLCEPCFMESIRDRVQRCISRFEMFNYDSRIAIAVSGGKDSIGLLHVLYDIEKEWPKTELIAISVDEGIARYRDEALELAERATRELGVEHLTVSFDELFGISMDDIAKMQTSMTPCSYCGILRRRALDQTAKRVEADRLATGHTLDDMAQSVLLNIFRGDLDRLSNFDPGGRSLEGFIRRVKPFCEVPERESTLYAYLRGIGFQNLPCPHAGEAMRNDMRRFLNRMEVDRPGTLFTVYRTGLKLASERLDVEKRGVCRLCGEPTTEDVCRVCQIIDELS